MTVRAYLTCIIVMAFLPGWLRADVYEEQHTGIKFPEKIGDCERGKITPYEAEPKKSGVAIEYHAPDAQIDKLVYELYEPTPEEIAVVEGETTTAEMQFLPEAVATTPEEKPAREKSADADPPPAPTHPSLTPEQAEGNAAHYYSAKEEPPPYGKND